MVLAQINLELTHPALLAGLALLPVLAWYYFRSLVDLSRWQRLLSLACRGLIATALVLAVAGLAVLSPNDEQFVVFAVDQSKSIGPEARRAAREFLDRAAAARGPHRIAFLPFAAGPGRVRAEWSDEPAGLDELGTDLAAAIEVAAASIPPSRVGHVVVLSDGNQTDGDALRAAAAAGAAVSTVPLKPPEDPEVQVSEVKVPHQVREGENFYVEVVISSNHDDEGVIEIFRGPHKIKLDRERYKINRGETPFRFPQALIGERQAIYTVKLSGFKDKLEENNTGTGLVYAAGKPRVLLIASDAKEGRLLRDALEAENIDVETRPPRGMPESLAELENYEMLVLANVPATVLSQRMMELARAYVEFLGGGFLMIGGDQSFGLGGYYRTRLEDILPVRSDFEKEKEKKALAMVLIIDRSGSMSGQKLELAKEAAKNAVELLGPKDQIGVIAFDSEIHWVTDQLQSGSQKGQISDQISRIDVGGGTIMYPPLKAAHETLAAATARFKHVILLTDGIAEQEDFEGLATAMSANQITVTTVAVGEDADRRLLEEIARLGKGRFYATDDPSSVPQIFAKETVSAGKAALEEDLFIPQRIRPTPVLADVDFESAPLLGHVRTRFKDKCEPILATPRGDPVLAWWRYGLGMSIAFTSDAKARWAAEWVSQPIYQKFWAQVVRHGMRKEEAKGVVVRVEPAGRHASVTLDAVDVAGRFVNAVKTEVNVIDPRLATRVLALTQTAPGRYKAELDTPLSGSYHLEISQTDGNRVLFRQSRGLAVGYPDELRLKPANTDLLRELARVSGGRYDPTPEEVFEPLGRTARRSTPLWPALTVAALVLLLFDVALRRLDLSLLFGRTRAAPAAARDTMKKNRVSTPLPAGRDSP
jgi:Mg-chelatase subunit ChlD